MQDKEETNVDHILEFIWRDNERFDLYVHNPSNFIHNINFNHFIYEEYIRNFFRNSSTEQLVEYSVDKPDLYLEKSLIFDPTF